MKKVSFVENPNVKKIEKSREHYRRDRKLKENRQRLIIDIETYMRRNGFLNRNEYLDLQKNHVKGLRTEFINFICHTNEWIRQNENFNIIEI